MGPLLYLYFKAYFPVEIFFRQKVVPSFGMMVFLS